MAETASSTSRESVILPVDNQAMLSTVTSTAVTASITSPATAHTTIGQVHYNNTSTYSMSKSVSTATDLSDDMIDNIIYSDINDLYGNRDNKKTTAVTTQTNNFDCNDIYATIDRKNKTSHKQAQLQQQQQNLNNVSKHLNNQNHFSDEFIDNSIRNYSYNTIISNNNITNNNNNTNNNTNNINLNTNDDYYRDNSNCHSDGTSDYYSHHKGGGFSISQNTNNIGNAVESVTQINNETNSNNKSNTTNHLPQIKPRSTYSLPRNSELAAIDSLELYDIHQSHLQNSHHSLGYIPNNIHTNNKNYTHYSNIKSHNSNNNTSNSNKNLNKQHIDMESNFNSPHHHKLSSERLEYELSNSNIYSAMQYKNYDDYNYNNIKDSWQRSASCKELYDLTYEDIKRRTDSFLFEREFLTSDRIDSPITRYDESRHSMYVPKNYSIDNSQEFQNLPETKIYSSSYPGTTYNTIDHQLHKRNHQYHNNYDFNGSQDDISHDSYELLEKSEDDIYYRIKQIHSDPHTRSCSIDSGHYVPTDDDSPSELGYLKYRTPLDVKCKSAADIMNDRFFMEDPRDLPREKLCVKSDGSFYKHIKKSMGSRTSSQDSKSDFFESKISKSSDSSKKSKDSVYHTDSKKSRETIKSKYGSGYNSRTSSQESKESFGIGEMLTKNYEMPKTTGKKPKSLKTNYDSISRNSSQESKSDYYDAQLSMERSFEGDEDFDDNLDKDLHPKVKSHESLMTEIKMQTQQNSFYETQTYSSTFPTQKNPANKTTTKVHSISLQNVETERHLKTCSNYKSPDICSVPKPIETHAPKATHIWPEEIEGLSTVVADIPKSEKARAFRKKSDSENIFSFDKDKIESLTGSSPNSEGPVSVDKCRKSPDYPLTPELLSEFDKQNIESPHSNSKKTSRKEELMAKTHFEEYNPKLMIDANIQLPEVFTYTHATVERTKSDPNSLANRPRLGPNSRRHTLMHQKSIDLTPADSSEEEYLYKQIPSAPPMCRTHGSHFELPKCYDSATMPKEIPQNGFELPKSFFKEYEKRNNKNLKEDIPYILHKRHVMNGTAPVPLDTKQHKYSKPKSPRSPKSPKMDLKSLPQNECTQTVKIEDVEDAANQGFLFTQNIDLSKIDPVTLEIDKTTSPSIQLSSPKRDITKMMDPSALETLNNKLSQIESDSGPSSKTDSIQRLKQAEQKAAELSYAKDVKNIKKDIIISNKRANKTRITPNKNKQPGKPKNKAKTRITSFSSDDESLDSDDVFGSAEAMPTKLEFSPPQSRKEIEPILKHEYSKITSGMWARGQTMSSTEIEGSPPQCRRLADLENRYHTSKLDAPHITATELRRISERSFSIPSSEEDNNTARKVETKSSPPKKTSPILEQTNDKLEGEKKLQKTQGEANAIKREGKLTASRTKLIEEMIDSSIIMRSKGHAPILFAHARLNLSEGSAFASLQRQKSTQDSPGAGRRAKSLDTPVISLHKLPPMNAYSSKDDTVDFEEEAEILETKPLNINEAIEEEKDESVQSCVGLISSYDTNTTARTEPIASVINIENDELELLDKLKYIEKITLQGVKIKEKRKTRTKLRSGNQLILEIPKYKFEPFSSGNSSIKTSPAVSRASSIESSGKSKLKSQVDSNYKTGTLKKKNTIMTRSEPKLKKSSDEKSPPSDSKIMKANKRAASQEDTFKRTKSQDLVPSKKEKSKSIEKIEIRRFNSRDRKSVEESELDKAKRKERQQKLYESAMKQTISMMSPVKDNLPIFPAPEDKISVKTEGDKIIIDAHIQSKPEDHVFIAKSPKKLDSSLVKFSRSFDDTAKSMEKIDKANRSFEDRNKSFEESDKSADQTAEDILLKSPRKLSKSQEIKQRIEGSVVHKKFEGKSKSLENQVEGSSHQHLDVEYKTRSLDNNYETYVESTSPDSDSNCRQEVIKVEVHQSKYLSSDSDQHRERKSTDSDSKSYDDKPPTKPTNLNLTGQRNEMKKTSPTAMFAEQQNQSRSEDSANEMMDMQAIISERRSLDILKRQSLSSLDAKECLTDNNDDDSTWAGDAPKEPLPKFPHRVPTIECEDASSEDKESESSSIHKLNRNIALAKLNLERSRSDETTSWMTLECEEIVGNIASDKEQQQSAVGPLKDGQKYLLENQNTLDDTKDSIFIESEIETPPHSNIVITPPDSSPTIEKYELPGTPVNSKKTKDSDGSAKTLRRRDFPKLSVGRSRSSDTASSIEKDLSPVRGDSVREKGSLDEESSVSCSISRPLGISQDINITEHLKCKELRDTMLKLKDNENSNNAMARTKIKSPTLEKQCPIDLGSGSELDQDIDQIESNISKILQRDDESHSSSSSANGFSKELVNIPIHSGNNNNNLCNANNNNNIKINGANKPAVDASNKLSIYLKASDGDRSSLESKSSLDSKGSLSVESKGSFETESSSGSLGIAQRRGDLPQREQKTTWRPYPIESSGSSSVEDNWNSQDRNTYENFELSSDIIDDLGKFENQEKKESSSEDQKESDSDFQDELSDFPATFGYPEMTSSLGIGANPADIIGYSSGFGMGRTLSRISERSTNSEKSSMEEEMSNIEEDISAHEESIISSDHQNSVSSDIHTNSNPAYVSDADRRTSAEMPDIPCDSAAAERLSELYKANTVKTGRFQVLTVDENKAIEKRLHDTMNRNMLSHNGSQDSEDWPLPEIPFDPPPPDIDNYISSYHIPHSNKQIPKTFAWRKSVQSQDSENWPSPPSSVIETPVIEDVETFYLSEAQTPAQVMIDSYTDTTITLTKDDDEDSDPDYAEVPEIAPEPPTKDYDKQAKAESSPVLSQPMLPYEETVYLMSDKMQSENSEAPTCLASTLSSANCLRLTYDACSSNKASQQNILKDSNPDKVIIVQPTRSSHSPLCDDDFFLNDDVFCPGTVKIEISPDDSKQTDYVHQKFSRGSNNSDTSIDDMLSASCGTYMEDTVRRNLEPRRLSSGSCKKCSHSSHSEEETSSMGTDLDGTVKMGIQNKKCTHSSHSEDTSVGLSLSEWSTGTNTVRQYANLSGSDSLSAVSNISGGAKSEKSNHTTRSSLSSNNKSTESLNEKSGSFSSSKNRFSLDNGSDGPKYEIFSNSETDKFTSSETKSDETTLTLNEIVQSITDWSSAATTPTGSSSSTLKAQNDDYHKDKFKTSIEYVALKPPKPYKRLSSLEDRSNLPAVHSKPSKSRQSVSSDGFDSDSHKPSVKSTERPMKIPPKVVEVHTKSQHDNSLNKRRSLELMSQRYHSQDISESENFNEKLYSQNEKFAERYQSQEFIPLPYNKKDQTAKVKPHTPPPAPPPTPSTITQQPTTTPVAPSITNIPDVVTIKHHSYDDKTLSKSQIREYKTSKMRHSQSFHEHLVTSDLNSIDEEKIGSSTSTTTHTSENTTSTDNSSPMMPRPDKLIKCSPYYSSSLSSESPPIQVIQKPPRKGSIPKNIMPKSPPSGNDTDSSLDFRQQDPKFRTRGYRKRKQVPAKRSRMDHTLEQQESSECSEGYFPEIDSGSSDMSKELKYPDFEEEPELLPEDFEEEESDYNMSNNNRDNNINKSGSSSSAGISSSTIGGGAAAYPGVAFSNKFEGLDMSENVDEMGFPRYDRLGHITNPLYQQQQQQHQKSQPQHQQLQHHLLESSPSPPIKPARQRKRQLKREESIVGKESPQYDVEYRGVQYTPESGSGTETRAGLSDDICYSSEDSFAAGYVGPSLRYHKNVEIPYPDFLSDYENEQAKASYIELEEEEEEEKLQQQLRLRQYQENTEFDISMVPPPYMFNNNNNGRSKMGDN